MNPKLKKGRSSGFTFVESLAMAAIATVIGSIAVGAGVNLSNFQKARQTDNRLGDLRGGLVRYYGDVGAFPSTTVAATTPTIQTVTGLTLLPVDPLRIGAPPAPGWQGPYLKRGPQTFPLQDAWKNAFYYQSGVSGGVDVAVILSVGANGRLETNLTSWTGALWSSGGDDQAMKVTSQEISKAFVDQTLQILARLRNQLESQSPMRAPATFNTALDSWGNPIVYRQCSRYSAVLYSYGKNKADDSNGVTPICTSGLPGGDDLSGFVPWSPYGRLPGMLNDGWTGGMHADQAVCQSYTYVAVNNFNDPLTISYYDVNRSLMTATVAAHSTGVVNNVYPWAMTSAGYGGTVPLSVYRNGILYDAVVPANADMDQDCVYQKVFINSTGN